MKDIGDLPLWARLALAAHDRADVVLQQLRHCIDGLTLGLFPDALLDHLTYAWYTRSRQYHDPAHNHRGLFEWERLVIEQEFPPAARVLLTSAGGGREALALLAGGHAVVATECVASLAQALARNLEPATRAGTARVLHLPPDQVPTDLGPFDAGIVGWGGYCHLQPRPVRLAFLRSFQAALKPGAPLLLSFLGATPGHSRSARAVALLANIIRAPRRARRIEPGESTWSGFARHFAPGEVTNEVQAAGFLAGEEEWHGYPHLVVRAPVTTQPPAPL